jgi:hypothetical protein
MVDDATTEFVQELSALIERFKGTVWREAFKAGGEAMRDSILRAAQDPITVNQPLEPLAAAGERAERLGTRAPRGAVGRAIDALLKEHPGISIQHMEKIISLHQPEIAQKSIGNEVRRMENIKYRRDHPGGYLWFLIDHSVDQEVGEPTSQASVPNIFNRKL